MKSLPSMSCALGLLGALVVCGCGGENGETPVDNGTPEPTEARSEKKQETNPAVTDAAFSELVAGNNAFAMDLYQGLSAPSDNLFYSPLSISVALAMTYAGAKGSSEAQMAQALHFTLPQDQLHPAMDKLILDMAARNLALHDTQEGPKAVKVNLTNAAWAQTGYQFLPTYLDTIAVNYDAGVKLLDFSKDPDAAASVINDWVAEKTEDKIQDLIPPGTLTPVTRLVLTNTLYFYANWAHCFVKESTADGPFHAPAGDVTVPMMQASLSTSWAEGDGWQMAELPYEGGKLVMSVVLPDAGRFDEVRAKLTGDWIAQANGLATQHMVTVRFPKFKFTWGSRSLVEQLKALGMIDPFDLSTADFSGMTTSEKLFIADVLHKAFVGVDESGTEAAAATAVVMSGNAGPDKNLQVDRPFVFFIRDQATGTLLFVGQVADPSRS